MSRTLARPLRALGAAALGERAQRLRIVAGVLIAAVVLRFRHWVLPVSDEQSEALNPVAARMTGFMVTLLSCAQSYFYLSLALQHMKVRLMKNK